MHMNMDFGMRMEQSMSYIAHEAISNPDLTIIAEGLCNQPSQADFISKNYDIRKFQAIETEVKLLSEWEYKKGWERYLDAPLLAHADAALCLRKRFDAVVAILSAGSAYARLFEMMGFAYHEIRYSHHKKNMTKPEIDTLDLRLLKEKQSILLVDVDICTGETLRKVHSFLKNQHVNVQGAYIGLSAWPSIESDQPNLGDDTINFDYFWKTNNRPYRMMRYTKPYIQGIIPHSLDIFSANPKIDIDQDLAFQASCRVNEYLQDPQSASTFLGDIKIIKG